MKWLILFLFVVADLAMAEMGSGEHIAHPPQIVLAEVWLYNNPVPVYRIDIEHAGEFAELQAAEAAVTSVRPEFKTFTAEFQKSLDYYVVGRQDSGLHTIIYIRRNIVADWLITS
jgi:hypothetical protein